MEFPKCIVIYVIKTKERGRSREKQSPLMIQQLGESPSAAITLTQLMHFFEKGNFLAETGGKTKKSDHLPLNKCFLSSHTVLHVSAKYMLVQVLLKILAYCDKVHYFP
ncbi:hypothetical protein CHARACLAT_026943 [Characodon lateralis]|uniref:Uncharacterized protein n=1 Tax=Characodon lateralis TaxID=208331 RepID=A0ABU7DKM8_9TELE|nr:hypothetical protein [Characodon lateralis]